MRKTKFRLFLVLAAIILAGGSFFLYTPNSEKRLREHEVLPEEEKRSFVSVQQFHYVQNKDGRNEWRLEAAEAAYYHSGHSVGFKDVRFVFFLEDGREVHITGDTGSMELDKRSVELRGNVRVTFPEEVELQTEEISYDDEIKQITSVSPVRIQTPRYRVSGVGLRAWVPQRRLILENEVAAYLMPEQGGLSS